MENMRCLKEIMKNLPNNLLYFNLFLLSNNLGNYENNLELLGEGMK